MADYSTIKGFTVQTLTSDPYATAVSAGTWASGGNTPKYLTDAAGAGTTTAGLGFGGYTDVPGYANLDTTVTYNGTAWTEVNALNTGRYKLAGCGTSTAALAYSGYNNVTITEWNLLDRSW